MITQKVNALGVAERTTDEIKRKMANNDKQCQEGFHQRKNPKTKNRREKSVKIGERSKSTNHGSFW